MFAATDQAKGEVAAVHLGPKCPQIILNSPDSTGQQSIGFGTLAHSRSPRGRGRLPRSLTFHHAEPRRMDESSPPELRAESDSNSSSNSDQDNPQGTKSLRGPAMLYASIAIIGAVTDLWTKQAIFPWRGLPGEKDIWWIIDGFFGIETAVNIGAVFGSRGRAGHRFRDLVGRRRYRDRGLAVSVSRRRVVVADRRAGHDHRRDHRQSVRSTGNVVADGLSAEQWRSGVRDWILWQASDSWKWPNFQHCRFVVGGRSRHVAVSIVLYDGGRAERIS